MELDKLLEFEVICDYEDILRKAIELYNQTYKTDFMLKEMIYDEVDFAKVQVSKYKIPDIFSLGAMYSRMSEKK
jgi:hypothetical protein